MKQSLRKTIAILLSALVLFVIIQVPLNISATDSQNTDNTDIKSEYDQSLEKESDSTTEFTVEQDKFMSSMITKEDIKKMVT